jgi:diaminopimelate decarboxylase
LHVHLGTGLKDVATYLQAIREVLEFARKVESQRRLQIRFLDFGGGFGVPTVRPLDQWDERLAAMGFPPGPIDPGKAPTLAAFAEAIVELMGHYYPRGETSSMPNLLFEPGRAITSSAQILLLSILAVKPGPDGSQRVILDGGKNIAILTDMNCTNCCRRRRCVANIVDCITSTDRCATPETSCCAGRGSPTCSPAHSWR